MSSSSSRAVSMTIGTAAPRPQPLADLEPVELREHHVEHDEVDVLRVEAGERLLAVPRLDDAVPVAFERVREELLDGLLVVDEQDGRGVRHREPTEGPTYYSPRIADPTAHSRTQARTAGAGAGAARSSARQRPALPRHLAARRAAAPDRRLQRRAAGRAPAADAAADLRRRRCGTSRSRTSSRASTPTARRARRARSGRLAGWSTSMTALRGFEALTAVEPDRSRRRSRAAAASRLRNVLVPRARPIRRHDRGHGPPRRHGRGRGRERQRLGHGRPDRARARVRDARSGTATQPVGRQHTIIFLSTDGGAFGGLGAARFAAALAGPEPGRRGRQPRLDRRAGPAAARDRRPTSRARRRPRWSRRAAARITEQTGTGPGRTSALGQLIDLGFPFSLYEQAPFVGRGIPAITLTTGGDRPPASFGDTPERLDRKRLTDIGRAAQALARLARRRVSSSRRAPAATSTSASASSAAGRSSSC